MIHDPCLRLSEQCARGTLANAPPHGNRLDPSGEVILAAVTIQRLFGTTVEARNLSNTFPLLVGRDVVIKLIAGVNLIMPYEKSIKATSNPLRSSLSTVSRILMLPKSWIGCSGWPVALQSAARESASQVSRTTLKIG